MELLVPLLVAVVSVGLFALAVAHGWLGPDVDRGATFCEASRDGILRQPANTWSNGGFVVAGLMVGWHAATARGAGGMRPGLATAYACVLVLVGPASAAMHATESACGGRLDLFSMYLVAGFAAAYALTRLLRRGVGTFAGLFVALVAGCELVGTISTPVPVVRFSGNLAFAVLLVTAIVGETLLWRRGEAGRRISFGLAAVGTLLASFVIWVMDQHGWCDPHSWLQGHAAWHLLNAAAGYLLYRLYDSERPGRVPERT